MISLALFTAFGYLFYADWKLGLAVFTITAIQDQILKNNMQVINDLKADKE